jgi:hypothetical protein
MASVGARHVVESVLDDAQALVVFALNKRFNATFTSRDDRAVMGSPAHASGLAEV